MGRGTHSKLGHWFSCVGPHLPDKFQPKWPRDHGWRSPRCTWTCCRKPSWGLWLDLTWPHPPTNSRGALQFLFYEIFRKTHGLGCTDRMTVFRAPWSQWWGYRVESLAVLSAGGTMALYQNFSHEGQTVWPPIPNIHTCTQARTEDSHLYYKDKPFEVARSKSVFVLSRPQKYTIKAFLITFSFLSTFSCILLLFWCHWGSSSYSWNSK